MQKLLEQQSKQLEALKGTESSGAPAPQREEQRSRRREQSPSQPRHTSRSRGNAPAQRGRAPKPDVTPSKVLHLRNTPRDATQEDVEDLFHEVPLKVVLLPGKPQALVEMSSVEAATKALTSFQQGKVAQINGNRIYFNYSHRAEIEPPRDPAAAAASRRHKKRRNPEEEFDNFDSYDSQTIEEMRPSGDEVRTVAQWNAYVRSYDRRSENSPRTRRRHRSEDRSDQDDNDERQQFASREEPEDQQQTRGDDDNVEEENL